MKKVLIPKGWFWMGSEGRYRWESPRHRVWLDDFELAQTPVTRGEYKEFLNATGHVQPAGWNDSSFSHSDQPVVGVDWFAASSYCEWLSQSEGLAYRLPTEAEWEKACRGNLDNADYAWGDEPPDTLDYFRGEWKGPRPVGEWRPNGYGLFNMGDNVHEWCSDWYDENYYSLSPDAIPQVPKMALGVFHAEVPGDIRSKRRAPLIEAVCRLVLRIRITDFALRDSYDPNAR